MDYEYKMVPMAIGVKVAYDANPGLECANMLAGVVNQQAVEGWEFYRTDQFQSVTQPGCVGGGQPQTTVHYVITFRRPKYTGEPALPQRY